MTIILKTIKTTSIVKLLKIRNSFKTIKDKKAIIKYKLQKIKIMILKIHLNKLI
jgi:hypothetical protein